MTEHDREQRLEQIIADYLAAEDAGTAPEPKELVAANPDLADDLRTFFREHHRIGRLSAPLRAAARGPAASGPEPTVDSSASPQAAPGGDGRSRPDPRPHDPTPGDRVLTTGNQWIADGKRDPHPLLRRL